MLALALTVVSERIEIGMGCQRGNLNWRGRRRGRVSFVHVAVVGVVRVSLIGSWVLRASRIGQCSRFVVWGVVGRTWRAWKIAMLFAGVEIERIAP